jgi:diguanylate cyclase (GGDEF)-like protein
MARRYVAAFGLACGAAVGAAGVVLAAQQRREVVRERCRTREARTRAHTDGLTGLPNRDGLCAMWPTLGSASRVLALLDLDGFKPVNDTYGHAAGDVVLAVVAARLHGMLPGGCAVRLGGDEFVAVLPAPMRRAHADALRIAATVALSIPLAEDITVTVTASIGLTPAGADLGKALAHADAAMYRAKATRTGIAVYDPCRDDRPRVAADPRPAVRVRELPHADVRADVLEVAR